MWGARILSLLLGESYGVLGVWEFYCSQIAGFKKNIEILILALGLCVGIKEFLGARGDTGPSQA